MPGVKDVQWPTDGRRSLDSLAERYLCPQRLGVRRERLLLAGVKDRSSSVGWRSADN
jgi:hypothetical protein